MAKHHRREKAEDGNGLEDVEDGDHPRLDAFVVGRDVSVGDGKGQAQHIGHGHAHEGIKRIERERANGVGDGDDGDGLAEPVDAGADDGRESRPWPQRATARSMKNGQVRAVTRERARGC